MKKVAKKRVIYYRPWSTEVWYGGEEYDATLSDANILNSIHTTGKTTWLYTDNPERELWLLRPSRENPRIQIPAYKIIVETFYIEVPTFWDRLFK